MQKVGKRANKLDSIITATRGFLLHQKRCVTGLIIYLIVNRNIGGAPIDFTKSAKMLSLNFCLPSKKSKHFGTLNSSTKFGITKLIEPAYILALNPKSKLSAYSSP